MSKAGPPPVPPPHDAESLRETVTRLAQYRAEQLDPARESRLRQILEEGRKAEGRTRRYIPGKGYVEVKRPPLTREVRLKRLYRRDAIVHTILGGRTFLQLARLMGERTKKETERMVCRWPLERISLRRFVRLANVLGVSLDVLFASLEAIRLWGEDANPEPAEIHNSLRGEGMGEGGRT